MNYKLGLIVAMLLALNTYAAKQDQTSVVPNHGESSTSIECVEGSFVQYTYDVDNHLTIDRTGIAC